MIWPFIISGFTLGLVSSLHCVGMCGPLSLALPFQRLTRMAKLIAIFFYQGGRILTYSALGLVFGLAGRGLYLAGFQQWFSIGMGALILVLIIQYWIFRKRVQPTILGKFYLVIQQLMGHFIRGKGSVHFLLFGIINGFLPCGMVYVALAGALVTSKVDQSVLFMGMFGLGTVPAMVAVATFSQFFSLRIRNSFRKIVPVFISIMAVALILRGMNLGIPFLSPALQPPSSGAVICH